jgi:hypothetical protein
MTSKAARSSARAWRRRVYAACADQRGQADGFRLSAVMKMPSGQLILTPCPTRCRCRTRRLSELQVSAQIAESPRATTRALRAFGDGGYLMGWVRFGGCIGLPFLGLAAVAPLAITSAAADGRRHRDVHVQNVHHSGLVHHRVHATSPAAAPSAVRTAAQLEGAQSTIIVVAPEPVRSSLPPKQCQLWPNPPNLNL